MSGLEIFLLLMGAVMVFGSFFITEKFSAKDVDELKALAEDELKRVIEDKIADAGSDFEDNLKVSVEDAMYEVETKTEKQTNENIKSINDYSDTVLGAMNKSHNEVMFMYSMLNEKQEKLEEMSENLEKLKSDIKAIDETVANKFAELSAKEQELARKAAELEKEEKAIALEREALQEVPSMKIASMASQLQNKFEEAAKSEDEKPAEDINSVVSEIRNSAEENDEPLSALAAFESLKKNGATLTKENKNKQILEMHDIGMTEIDIAKKLGVGLGEVKFVLGLYQEAK